MVDMCEWNRTVSNLTEWYPPPPLAILW
jgi:hypothetical protein